MSTKIPLPERQIHIWDHPESRVQFLETVLNGSDWKAVIHADPAKTIDQGRHELESINQTLLRHGFTTHPAQDEHGQPTLTIHHLGDATGVLASLKELGLIEGSRRTLTHLNVPFGHALKKHARFHDQHYREPGESPRRFISVQRYVLRLRRSA